jgi:MacB-like protein
VIRGRGFTENDTGDSRHVAVVNQAFAKKFFPGEDPIGRRFGSWAQQDIGAYEIVGVVADAKYNHPREDARPMFFRPLAQWQRNLTGTTEISIEAQSHISHRS